VLRNPGRTAFLLVLFALAAPGCRRERGHSKAFDDASALFRKVYAEKLDDSYDDPRMQEVERLLSVVPPQSIDAPAAQELQQRITAGREALKAQREAAATNPAEQPPPADPWADERNDAPPPPPPGPPDAGAPSPRIGMTVEELKRRFSDCFSFDRNVEIPDHGHHDVYAISGTEACGKAHPGLVGRLLVIDEAGEKIMGTAPASALEPHYYYPDGGEAPPPQPKP
jgi:hypothetical protein